eukprot:6193431-Pleurochrysis_carterae.AAC.1
MAMAQRARGRRGGGQPKGDAISPDMAKYARAITKYARDITKYARDIPKYARDTPQMRQDRAVDGTATSMHVES